MGTIKMNTIEVCSILSKLSKAIPSINKDENIPCYLEFHRITEDQIVLSIIKRFYPTPQRKLWIRISDLKFKPKVIIEPADCSEGCPAARDGDCHPLREWGCRKSMVKKLLYHLENEDVELTLPLK